MSSSTDFLCVSSAVDVYNDYLDHKKGIRFDLNKVKWKLTITGTPAEYSSWEATLEHGFKLGNIKSDDTMVRQLVLLHVDYRVYRWWSDETHSKREGPWEDIRKLFRAKFLPPSELDEKVEIHEKVEPLSGLNMQLKKVHDGACMTTERSQRWSLFQTQCTIRQSMQVDD